MRFLALTFIVLLACDIPTLPHFPGGTYQPGPEGLQMDIAIGRDTTNTDLLAEDTPHGEFCVPNCYGRSCGPDGCGGLCGVCPKDTACSYDHSTCIPKSMQRPYGGACLPNEYCKPYLKNSAVASNYYKNYDWPKCLNDQCRDGPCWNYKCTQVCKNPQDPEVGARVSTDCPKDTRCVPWQGKGICLPDAGYKPCQTSATCAENEFCTPMELNGQWELRCTPSWGDHGLGEACNDDPDQGATMTCHTGICMDRLCSRTCATGKDCLTPGTACKHDKCPDGRTCTKDTDCSAFQCKSVSLYTNTAFNLCIRKQCNTDADCPAVYYCRPAIWSQGYDSRCEPGHPGGLDYGAACDDRHPCAEKALCVQKKCTKLCANDADCAFGLCTVVQQGMVAITPYIGTATVPFTACDPIRGSLAQCKGDAECGHEVCRTVTVLKKTKDNPRIPVTKSVCVTPGTKDLRTGSACGGHSDQACASGLCIKSGPGQAGPGYCAAPCVKQQDCPGFVAEGTGVYKTICKLRPILSMGTPSPVDDVLAGVCRPVQKTSSLNDCAATLACAATEVCSPFIQGYPQAPKIRFYCTTPAPDEVLPGQGCDPWNGHVKCSTGLCLPGQLPDTGICSMPCKTDSECRAIDPSMSCVSRPLLPGMADLKLAICSPPSLCTTCTDDSDCMTGYGCVDTSMGSWPKDYRCMPTCTKPGDCQARTQGKTCLALPCPAGNSGGASHDVCTDIVCP